MEKWTKRSEFVFDYILLFYHKSHKTNLTRTGSYINSLDWIKKIKKETINRINKKATICFQYATTVALIHEEIKKHPERITKIKPIINKFNREGINFLPEKVDWKKFEKNNLTSALNVL